MRRIGMLSTAAALLASGGVWVSATTPDAPGVAGQETDAPMTLNEAMDAALDDERHARAFYEDVIAAHGERRPFSNIIRAEERHEAALLAQYKRLGYEVPDDRWAEHEFEVPESFAEACDASIVAEVRNVRLYDRLLEATRGDEAVRGVFESLRAASQERHLRAFSRHGNGWKAVAPGDLGETQRAQQQAADQARNAMFHTLLGELMKAMMQGGSAGAIAVCSQRAPEIAQEVSSERGVEIGRTSWKLRNPSNTSPVWAQLPLDERPEEPVVLADNGGRLGAIFPIRVTSTCLRCHGTNDRLGPGVREQLDELYPDDHATGFKKGDLRGWFWVEVPAPRAAED